MKEKLNHFTKYVNNLTGHPLATVFAISLFIVWLVSGPLFHFSPEWQNIANIIPNIVAFLLLFIINNTQGRDTAALHLKLDELILATKDADDEIIGVEDLSEQEMTKLRATLMEEVRADMAKQHPDKFHTDLDEKVSHKG